MNEKIKLMQKGFAQVYLLIILLIIGGLGGYYYFSKSSNKPIVPQSTQSLSPTKAADETANEKTITNAKFNFTFKYPNNYFQYSSQTENSVYLATDKGKNGGEGSPMGLDPEKDTWLSVSVATNHPSSLEDYLTKLKQDSSHEVIKNQLTKIDNENAYSLEINSKGPQNGYTYEIVIIKNKNLYKIDFTGFKKDLVTSNKKIFDQILSTFKFLDQNQDETANWKTYTSSEYNPFFPDETIKKYNQTKQPDGYTNDENTKYIKFSIKYPANWQQGYFDDPVGGSEGKNSFIFSNGDYKITISKGYAPGGNSCDQKILKEILTQTSGFNLSRVKVFDSETGTFELCEKGGSNTRIGKIIYITPQNYDIKILDEMDQIISTFKFTN